MDNLSHDKYSYLNMPNMYDGETGEKIQGSPRADGVTIHLTVEEVKQITSDLRREIDDINQKIVQAIKLLMYYNNHQLVLMVI
ncbi:hypothetical protein P5783_20640 [Bacillus cereus]|nr:hypothetical protein [Bacillus cereus]MDF9529159.1 hypothetical protein [Bacillus cereus]MDG1576886.1 hypothetical protein [Bacillus cereus]